jgi:hypothetical protein
MREALALARGIAAFALTGLGLLVVLRGDGAGTHIVIGSLLIAAGITAATIGILFEIIDGRFPREPRRRR